MPAARQRRAIISQGRQRPWAEDRPLPSDPATGSHPCPPAHRSAPALSAAVLGTALPPRHRQAANGRAHLLARGGAERRGRGPGASWSAVSSAASSPRRPQKGLRTAAGTGSRAAARGPCPVTRGAKGLRHGGEQPRCRSDPHGLLRGDPRGPDRGTNASPCVARRASARTAAHPAPRSVAPQGPGRGRGATSWPQGLLRAEGRASLD